ncbi:MAG: cytochrome c-type biogenesis protein CcmH [Kofleriaceae bacterium]
MLRALLVCLWVLVAVACTRQRDPVGELEDRLYSPCCWRQSLRDHESPIANQLRAEIRERIAAGEAPDAIEADFVRRYGEDIRALPEGTDPRWMIGVAAGFAAVAGLALLAVMLRRRSTRASGASATPPPEDPNDTDRLDDELALVD